MFLRFRPELILDSRNCSFFTSSFLFASFLRRYFANAQAYWVALKTRKHIGLL